MYDAVTRKGPEVESFIKAVGSFDFSSLDDRELSAYSLGIRKELTGKGLKPGKAPDTEKHLSSVVFALVKESFRRVFSIDLYDEQIWAGMILSRGAVVEMATGEGKTFAGVFPAVLNAYCGIRTDIYTFNDYLAKRDANWLRPVYERLGVTVSYLHEGQDIAERKKAYTCDVIYMTARECGFDYLREFLAESETELYDHVFSFALVDEADSILIDEARIPLVIAASTDDSQTPLLTRMNEIANCMQINRDYTVDDYESSVYLTEEGISLAEKELGIDNLYSEDNIETVVALNNALYAREIVRLDVDYVVKDNKVQLVDEFTGRIAHKRHWPHGVHEAIEVKEGLDPSKRGRILSQITLQNFMKLYECLSGMTGTAVQAAEEFDNTYDLKVHVIPTHKRMIRHDSEDNIYYTKVDKYKAIMETVIAEHGKGRPILIGTASVEESENLSVLLSEASIKYNILNAKNDEMEADLIASAGNLFAVTVSTNMAGRGIDIKLGGPGEEDHDEVSSAGGLLVIGTDRHESIRVDSQLRGRAGRQGDPGESRFIISLEDDIFIRYNFAELVPARLLSKVKTGPVTNNVLLREASRLQKIVQGVHFDIRTSLSKYTVLLQEQSNYIRSMRNRILHLTKDKSPYMEEFMPDRFFSLEERFGRTHVCDAERVICLRVITDSWAEYLDNMAYIKDSIHIMKMSGKDPLHEYNKILFESFSELKENIGNRIYDCLKIASANENGIDTESIGIVKPSSTWTYIVSNQAEQLQLFPFLDSLAKAIKRHI
ncbi:MAG: accessory Sec system translocase SecA2 [Eubacteriales bacterium]|nr:accessory Sec system translocase SecA2 [Eubacteriales bacterium]